MRGREVFDDINFILIISKADLYANDFLGGTDMPSDRLFLTTYSEQLSDGKIIYPSPYLSQNGSGSADGGRGRNLAAFRSAGAVRGTMPTQPGEDAADTADQTTVGGSAVGRYAAKLRMLSNTAIEALRNVGSSPDSDEETRILGDTIRHNILETIENVFGMDRVYVFPISAEGGAGSERGPDELMRTEHRPPSQKLAELVFAAPTILTLHQEQSQVQTQYTRRDAGSASQPGPHVPTGNQR